MAKAKGKVIVHLECQECGRRTYTLRKPPKAQWKLELSKYCRYDRKHTAHKERKK
ncbi:MAG: 50S ribosomal protein L33 [Planctomycetota bacterium]|jgi:large subunit ribosomal protein L33